MFNKRKYIVLFSISLFAFSSCKSKSEKEVIVSDAKEVAKSDSTQGEKYIVNSKESNLKWIGYKVAANHFGHVDISSGMLMLKDGKIVSGSFIINLESIVAEDGDAEDNAKLAKHLKDPDFFDVEKYKEASFELTSASPLSGDSVSISGNLTIKGISHNISFPAYIKTEQGKMNAKANFTIDRTQWGLTYHSQSQIQFKDKFIKDHIDFELSLNASK